ncbi:rap guanine nucleotide exchange factor 1 [Aphelenchoides avenae]|nr:rap guanine nucleotide exchange factor 1 [Aphelenchus avenae]
MYAFSACANDLDLATTSSGLSAMTISKSLLSRISSHLKPSVKPIVCQPSVSTEGEARRSRFRPIPDAPARANPFTRPAGMKLPKDLEISLRYLQEVIRAGRSEMYIGSSSALLDALLQYMKLSRGDDDTRIKEALQAVLKWIDEQVVERQHSSVDADSSISSNVSIDSSSESFGVTCVRNLENCLLNRPTVSDASESNSDSGYQSSDAKQRESRTSESDMSGGEKDADAAYQFTNTSTSSAETDDSLGQLLQQLRLRKIDRFEPTFPRVEPDSDDDDSGVHVDEEREEREEKHGSRTFEEEVERRPDGREIRTKKTRTVNVSQSSRSVVIRTHGGGADDIIQKFRDGSKSGNDDSNTEQTEFLPTSLRKMRMNGCNGSPCASFLFADADDGSTSSIGGDDTSTKLKNVQHTSATVQSVSRQAKRDGRVVADNAAHKLDTAALNAKQLETYQGQRLLDRKGDGIYEENTIVRTGLPPSVEECTSPMAPIKSRVVQFVKTIGDDNTEGKENFFKATTLASYITLNDNLRFYEEQQRRKTTYSFGLTGTAASASTAPSQDYLNLKQLLQASDIDDVVLPSRYVDETEEVELQKALTYPQLLAITEKPSILESLEVAEYLVLRAKDAHSRPTEVRGGPKDALIVHATQPTGSLLYQEAFLVTYRSFVSSKELIQKLIRRFVYMSSTKDQHSQKAARQTFSVLVRVVDELCAVELTRELINSVTSFVYRLIRSGNYDFARILRRRLMERIEEKCGFRSGSSGAPNAFAADANNTKPGSLFDFRSSAIAKQITFLDAELFHKIEPAEMLWWAEEQDEKKSPNVVAFTEHFNKVSYWVRTQVIQHADQREREKFLLKFIKVMKQLRKMGNFNSYLAILSALDSGPVRRLDWPKSLRDQLQEHAEIMESSHSFKNYRTLLAETAPPCLPYIGLILQDLTFVHVGNADRLPAAKCGNRSNLLNYGKRWQQFAILDNIRRFKTWPYDIQKDDKVIRMFNGFNNYLPEEETWERSFEIKPRRSTSQTK